MIRTFCSTTTRASIASLAIQITSPSVNGPDGKFFVIFFQNGNVGCEGNEYWESRQKIHDFFGGKTYSENCMVTLRPSTLTVNRR
jgi:hypothetical protein